MSEQTLTIDFSDPDDYTFDSSLIEFTTSQVPRLKDLTPDDSTFYASFASDEDGNWGNGTLTGTLGNSATISSGQLDCSGATAKNCSWSAEDNADSAQTGTIVVRLIPEYSGSPAGNRFLFSINAGDGTLKNVIQVTHLTAGTLLLTIYDNNTASIINGTLAAWSPTADTTYEFALSWDLTIGSTKLFIDKVQQGATQTATGTRVSTNISKLALGTGSAGTESSDCVYEDVIVYSTVQDVSAVDMDSISATRYSIANPTIEYNTTTIMNFFSATNGYDITYTNGANDTVQGVVIVNSVDKYFTTEWTTSDGTYSQSNSETVLNTNIGDLDIDYAEVSFKWFLHSDDGSTRTSLSQCVVKYSVMNFVVEDGTSKTDATSYATVNQYRQYWLDKGVIVSGTTEQIQAYLNNAAEYIDGNYCFEGVKTEYTQALEWPRMKVKRYSSYYPPYDGYYPYSDYDFLELNVYYESDEIPQEIIEASCCIAYKNITGSLQPESVEAQLKSYSVGPISKSYSSGNASVREFKDADSILKDLAIKTSKCAKVG